eukprot:Platyproteum_vivax@DN6623_c0_g2_i6.p1
MGEQVVEVALSTPKRLLGYRQVHTVSRNLQTDSSIRFLQFSAAEALPAGAKASFTFGLQNPTEDEIKANLGYQTVEILSGDKALVFHSQNPFESGSGYLAVPTAVVAFMFAFLW